MINRKLKTRFKNTDAGDQGARADVRNPNSDAYSYSSSRSSSSGSNNINGNNRKFAVVVAIPDEMFF